MGPQSASTQTVETVADFGTDAAGQAQRWISELELAEKDHKRFFDNGKKVIKDYEAQRPEAGAAEATQVGGRYPLLWSNMATLAPAVMTRPPQAVVSRRFKDADPLARLASEVLERGLNFALDATDYADTATGVRDDFLLVGRGIAWVRYCPHYTTAEPADQVGGLKLAMDGGQPAPAPSGGPPPAQPSEAPTPPEIKRDPDGVDAQGGNVEPDGQISDGAEPFKDVEWEEVIWDHVAWDDYLHNPARMWSEVRWQARCAYLTRDELIKRFGEEKGTACPLNHKTGENGGQQKEGASDPDGQFAKAAVWEIWDIVSRQVFWINREMSSAPLDVKSDPLGLTGFFPCPRPPMATRSPRSVLPIPDYHYYRQQAKDVEDLTGRINKLMDAIRLVGFYAGEEKDKIQNALSGGDNRMIPVDSWAAFAEKGGVKGMVEWLPIDMVQTTLTGLISARQLLIEDANRLSGVADVQRGEVDAEETATATSTKTNWGTLRVRAKQQEMARFARDCLRLGGEVIARQFDPKTLAEMTNIKLFMTVAEKQAVIAQLQTAQQNYQHTLAAMQAQHPAQPPQAPGGPPAPPPQAMQPPPPPAPPPPEVQEMLQKPTWEELMKLMRSNSLRSFRIDIETDSTIEPDDQEEKQRRIEFVEAVGQLLEKMLPLIQLAPAMLPMATQSLLYLVRGFRVGREMEDVIERAMDQLAQQAGQGGGGQQPKGPNPQAEAAKAQAATVSAQASASVAQTRQFEAETERGRAVADAQLGQAQIAAENMRTQAGAQVDMHMQHQDHQADFAKAVATAAQKSLVHDINSPKPIEAPTR